MLDTKNKDVENILALGRLYEFSSNKRFHLIKNEFLDDQIGKAALGINQVIKNTKGVDIFEAVSEIDLLEYEKILNDYTTVYTNFLVGTVVIGDEIKLADFETPFSVDQLKSYEIVTDRTLKPLLKKYNIIIPEIVNICKSADYVSLIPECASLFLIKKIKFRNTYKLVLAHLSFEDSSGNQGNYETKNFVMTSVDRADFIKSKRLALSMVFFFDFGQFEAYADNPVRLFIKALDLYGENITIGLQSKKFYYKVLIPAHVQIKDLGEYLRSIVFKSARFENDIKFIALAPLVKYNLNFNYFMQ